MSEEKKLGITKLVLSVKDVEITLTPDEAKALRDELLKLFPEPKVVEHDYPYRPWYEPFWNIGCTSGTTCEDKSEVTLSLLPTMTQTSGQIGWAGNAGLRTEK